MTCRCPICHRADAGTNRQRKSYVVIGITKDENAYSNCTKEQSHRLRRKRERILWAKDMKED